MDLLLKDKVALVTGAGSQIGYGRGIALTLAEEGCDVVVADIDLAGAKIPKEVEGKSLLPLLNGKTKSLHDCAVASPADHAAILVQADVYLGARVLEAGTGSGALTLALCRALRERYDIAVVTNDIYTEEDAQFLVRNEALVPERSLPTSGFHVPRRDELVPVSRPT